MTAKTAKQAAQPQESAQIHYVDLQGSPVPSFERYKTICVSHKALGPEALLEIVREQHIGQIVQAPEGAPPDAVNRAILIAKEPERVFADPALLLPNQKGQLVFPFNSSLQKNELMSQVDATLRSLPKSETIRDHVILVSDELFTNVLYHGPFSPDNGPIARTQKVTISDTQAGRLFVVYSDDSILVGTLDSFGTLNLSKLVERLSRSFSNGIFRVMNMGLGGAGIGMRLVFERSAEFYVLIEEGKRSFIGCQMKLGSLRKRESCFGKSVHFVSWPPGTKVG